MNSTLLIYWPIGPTLKSRVLKNLKKFPSHKFFDVLVLTDDVDFFAGLEYPNVKILNLDRCRSQYIDFLSYEQFPTEKRDDSVYRQQFNDLLEKDMRFSIHIQRFGFLYENIAKYTCISPLDCDMVPVHTDDQYSKFQNYIDNVMPMNSVSSNRAYYIWDSEPYISICNKYARELQKDYDGSYIHGFDSLFKLYKFDDDIRCQFFNVWNHILLDSLKNRNILYQGSWNICIEHTLAVIYKLLNIRVNHEPFHYHAMEGMQTYNFPEDRYWVDWTNYGFFTNVASQKEYIDINREALTQYYTKQNLTFD